MRHAFPFLVCHLLAGCAVTRVEAERVPLPYELLSPNPATSGALSPTPSLPAESGPQYSVVTINEASGPINYLISESGGGSASVTPVIVEGAVASTDPYGPPLLAVSPYWGLNIGLSSSVGGDGRVGPTYSPRGPRPPVGDGVVQRHLGTPSPGTAASAAGGLKDFASHAAKTLVTTGARAALVTAKVLFKAVLHH